jgi:hypothetical protein
MNKQGPTLQHMQLVLMFSVQQREKRNSKRKESISYVYNISIIPVKIVIQISKFVVPKKVENHVRIPTIKVKKMENHFDQRQTK